MCFNPVADIAWHGLPQAVGYTITPLLRKEPSETESSSVLKGYTKGGSDGRLIRLLQLIMGIGLAGINPKCDQ